MGVLSPFDSTPTSPRPEAQARGAAGPTHVAWPSPTQSPRVEARRRSVPTPTQTCTPDSNSPLESTETYPADITLRLEKVFHGRVNGAISPEEGLGAVVSPSTLISRDIELTTTMDLLVARGKQLQSSSLFFIEAVECPGITPFDSANWLLWKHHVVDSGASCPTVALAISAVVALYKAQAYTLSHTRAVSLYDLTKSAFDQLLSDRSHDFSNALLVMFLLCLFELIRSEELPPVLKEPSELLMSSLSAWAQRRSSHSDVGMRVIAWLRILCSTTMRGGGTGLISNSVYELLPSYDGALPNIQAPASYQSDVSIHLHQTLCAPLFDFYLRLQMISGEIAQLTHYHRSRTAGADQEEVATAIRGIKVKLRQLWDARCAIQCQTPSEIRLSLAPKIADRVVSVIGICHAAYHAEIVEIDRVLGDPVSRWTDSRPSMHAIRDIVDGDWAQYLEEDQEKLNPGYLRPLFMYAIECMDREQSQWAVEKIAQIQSPIYRSRFFSAFGKALAGAQALKERRVTSKYFCISHFGVPPPFM